MSPASYRLGVNDTSNGHNEGSSSTSPGSPSHRRLPNAESRVPQVYLKGLNLDKKSLEEVIAEDCGVRELRQRIRGMKRWRREIERTVVWQREEYARVLAAIGKPKSESEQGKEAGEEDTPEEVSPAGPSGTTRKVVQFDVEEGKGEGKGKETGKEEVKETMKEEVKETGKEEVKETGVLRDEGWGVGGQTWEKGRLVLLLLFLFFLPFFRCCKKEKKKKRKDGRIGY